MCLSSRQRAVVEEGIFEETQAEEIKELVAWQLLVASVNLSFVATENCTH